MARVPYHELDGGVGEEGHGGDEGEGGPHPEDLQGGRDGHDAGADDTGGEVEDRPRYRRALASVRVGCDGGMERGEEGGESTSG